MKGRNEEYDAIVALDGDALATVMPLIQLWPGVPGAPRGQGAIWQADEADDVFRRLNSGLLRPLANRGTALRDILLDGGWMDPQAFGDVLERCCAAGQYAVPVTSLRRDERYQAVVAAALGICQRGAALRLRPNDFLLDAADLDAHIRALLSRLGLKPAEVDIVVDLGWIARETWEASAVWARSALRVLPFAKEWRNLAVAATGTPANAKGLQQNGISPRARVEWWLWKSLMEVRGRLPRMPAPGDYGAVHPDRVEEGIDPKGMKRIPLIRYATAEQELLVRGVDLEDEPDHLPRLLRRLIDELQLSPEGFDPEFSAADRWIAATDDRADHPGNRTTWKFVGQNRHITLVSSQIASLNET